MNPTPTDAQLIILAVVADLIVTGFIIGIVIYYFQKRIDASIQKSFFEYQTKYSRSYPKMLEIVDGFVQKYFELEGLLQQQRDLLFTPSKQSKNYDEQIAVRGRIEQDTQNAISELQSYLAKNRMYLPDSTANELATTLSDLRTLHLDLRQFRYHSDISDSDLVSWLKEEIEGGSLPILEAEERNFPVAYFIYYFYRVEALRERVEGHYKKVAELTG